VDLVILRLVHIGVGIFWVGAVFTQFFFLLPAANAIGPAAAPFQYQLVRGRRFATAVLASAVITIGAGIWLLWITSGGLDPDLLFGSSRIGFTLGGIVAILAFAVGSAYVYPRTMRIAGILDGPMTEARPPTPDEGAALRVLGGEVLRAGWAVVAGLILSVAAMATARYWPAV
jgi:hypothetical protein